MARTPLAGAVQDAVAAVGRRRAAHTRTRFVKEAGVAALGFGVLGRSRHPPALRPPRIVVVGAGLAGLSAARSGTQGYTAEIHEASDRIGGRCWTPAAPSRTARSPSTAVS